MDETRLHELMRLRATTTSKRSWRCPGLTTVVAYADGRLEGRSQLQLERHLAVCGHCLDEVAFLLRSQESEQVFDVTPALLARARALAETKTAFGWKPAWSWTALSAAMVLVALVLSLELREPRSIPTSPTPTAVTPGKGSLTPPPAVQPSPPARPTVRNSQKSPTSPELILPIEGAVIPRKDVEFRWREVKGSIDYEILVATAEGDVVCRIRTETTHARLPKDISLIPQQKYFVWVRADLPEGRTEKSPAVSFRVGNR
jgi:putative zinc finger protein